MRHIAEMNGPETYLPERNVVQRVDSRRLGVDPDDVLLVADLRVSRRQGQALRIDRIQHVVWGNAGRSQRLGIEIDHNLPVFSAIGRWQCNTLDGASACRSWYIP